MIPLNLNVGDTFDEESYGKVFRHKVIGFDGEGRYIAECIGLATDAPKAPDDTSTNKPDGELDKAIQPTVEGPKAEETKTEETEETKTEEPIDNTTAAEEPKEVKATAPKKKPTSKKKPAPKKK